MSLILRRERSCVEATRLLLNVMLDKDKKNVQKARRRREEDDETEMVDLMK